MRRYGFLVAAIVLFVSCFCLMPFAHADNSPPELMISEVLTGVSGNSSGEFVELYNPATTELDVTGWHVDFINAANDPLTSNIGNVTSNHALVQLTGKIAPQGHALFISPDYSLAGVNIDGQFISTVSNTLIASGGYIRITNETGTVIDLLAWGTAPQVGSWWHQSPAMATGNSIQRILPGDAGYTTGLTYMTPSKQITPQGGGLLPPTNTNDSDANGQQACEGVVLSEILPNAAGSDNGHEFIEIYNPTEQPVSLFGCSLQLGDTGKIFALPDEILMPATYRAFYDNETGITLPNTTAQVVWLLSKNNEEGVQYADALADNQSWALIDGQWQATLSPTPNAANELSVVEAIQSSTLAACDLGQERNPVTNRCRTVATAGPSLVACKAGQERNPMTNRCRSIATVLAGLVACKTGQTRNPETNRCRSVLSASTTLKPCASGQERNPATNRCRKISFVQNGGLPKIENVNQDVKINNPHWVVASVAILVAGGYAIFEWRQELQQFFKKHAAHLARTKA